jgi:heptaprenyl diphosphate synthase
MRIGLANVPLMLALDLFPLGTFFLLVLVKILGQALISGALFSYVFLFSLGGTVFSATLMYILRRGLGSRIGFTGIGIMGALASNGSQIAMARFFVFGERAILLVPPFLAAGIITGTLLGYFCEVFTSRSRWYRERVSL